VKISKNAKIRAQKWHSEPSKPFCHFPTRHGKYFVKYETYFIFPDNL
jgi:hypothetical protein